MTKNLETISQIDLAVVTGGKKAPKAAEKAPVIDSPLARYSPNWNPMRDGFSLH